MKTFLMIIGIGMFILALFSVTQRLWITVILATCGGYLMGYGACSTIKDSIKKKPKGGE